MKIVFLRIFHPVAVASIYDEIFRENRVLIPSMIILERKIQRVRSNTYVTNGPLIMLMLSTYEYMEGREGRER